MKNSYWKDGLSVKETKFSVIGLLTIITLIFVLVYHVIYESITPELLDLVKSLLLSFVGINAVDTVSTAFGKNDMSDGYEFKE